MIKRTNTTKLKKKEINASKNQDSLSLAGGINLGKKSLITPKNIALLVIIIVVIFFWKFKGIFIAGMVNGQPISRWQLNSQLQNRFGEQVLDNLISERLILSGARQKGIFVSSGDIEARVKEIEDKLKDRMPLSEALKAQGLTMNDFKRQIEIQISIEKMFEKESTVSSKEIDEYLEMNKEYTKDSTDTAKLRDDAKNILKQQKMTESFDKWFTDVKKEAKIQKYL